MVGFRVKFGRHGFLLVLAVIISSIQNPRLKAFAASTNDTASSLFNIHNQMTKEESCSCGVQVQRTKIIGGIETKPSEFPWMIALMYNGDLRCGGALINDRFAVTAAHCTYRLNKRFLSVNLGAHDISKKFETHSRLMRVFQVIAHPEYSPTTHQNDIALLELVWPIKFTPNILPVCLPPPGATSYDGKTATVAGWGRISEGGSVQTVLRKVDVPIVSMQTCQNGYPNFRIDTDRMICAGTAAGGKDSCQGDSGGPLVIRESGHYQLIGVVSFGDGCGRAGKPGVYANVNYYTDFILQNTEDALYCPAYSIVPPANKV